MLKIQEYLREHNSIEKLNQEFGIDVKRHGQYPNLHLFKYGIGSPMGLEIVRECRGLILDEAKDWNVVARAYDKFFNAHEGHAAKIDWDHAKVYEKLDGSICTVYKYDGAWHVSTSGTPDANCAVNNGGQTFADLFWQVWAEMGYTQDLDNLVHKDYPANFMFELCTPDNQVVVFHKKRRIVLHGARMLVDPYYLELSPEAFSAHFEIAKSYPLSSAQDCIKAAEILNPIENEGYVVVDSEYNRVKIKSPKYVALHHLRSDFSDRRIVDLVRLGEVPEVVSYFPEMGEKIEKIKAAYELIVEEAEDAFHDAYSQTPTNEDFKSRRKKFAAIAGKSKYRSVLFAMYDNKNAKEFIDTLAVDTILDWICQKSD